MQPEVTDGLVALVGRPQVVVRSTRTLRQQLLMVLGSLATCLRYRHNPRRGYLSRVAHLTTLAKVGVLLITHRLQADLRHFPTIAALVGALSGLGALGAPLLAKGRHHRLVS